MRPRLLAVGLCLAVLAAYLPALRAGFIWDDDRYVSANPLLASTDGLRRIWIPGETVQYYPLVFTSFWVEHHLWGLAPGGYHAVNILLHAANALLVTALLARLPMRGAWLAGFLFALHPLQVESVAWVTERKNLLSGLFYFLALGAFWRHEEERGQWLFTSLGLFILALLSKSVTATLPAAMLLARWLRGRPVDRRFLLSLLPFLLLGAALGLHTARMEVHHVGAHGPEWDLSFTQRFAIAGRALAFYLGKLAWPAGLTFVQYPRVVPEAHLPGQILQPLGFLALGAALWLARKKIGRGPVSALAFFAATLFPVLGFLNVYPMRYAFVADHYQYLACLGPIALAAAFAAKLPKPVLAAPLLALGILSFRQARIYESPETLWRDTLAKNPAAWMAHDCLGRILFNRGEVDESIAHYRTSLALKPDDFFAHNALGNIFLHLGFPKEGMPHLIEASRLEPSYPDVWLDLERGWREILRTDPADSGVHYNLGVTLRKQGRREEADACFRKALELRPGLEEARKAGVLGECRLALMRGAGAYISGLDTALLETMEGKKAWPRQPPPFPTVAGLMGKPTVVNNVETLSMLPDIIVNGGGVVRPDRRA